MYLDVDRLTAGRLNAAIVDCSTDQAGGLSYRENTPIFGWTVAFDPDCYVAKAREILGDELVEQLVDLKPKAEMRVVDRDPPYAALVEG